MQPPLNHGMLQQTQFFKFKLCRPRQLLYLGFYSIHANLSDKLNCSPQTSEIKGILVSRFKSANEISFLRLIFPLKRIKTQGFGSHLPQHRVLEEEKGIAVSSIHPFITARPQYINTRLPKIKILSPTILGAICKNEEVRMIQL